DAVSALAEQVAADVAATRDAGVEVTVVATPDDLLDTGVDGVVIASSTPTHAGLIRTCVAHATPTFCEKPVALQAAEATALHDVRLELLGTQDSVAAGLDDRTPLRSANPGIAFPGGPPWDFFLDRFADAFRAELAAFTGVVAGNRPSPCTLHDAVEASLVAEA